MEMIQEYLPMILNGAGGAVLGPMLAGMLGGRSALGFLGGILGGIAGGYGADMAGYSALIGAEGVMGYVQDLAEGAVGGGILGILSGILFRR